MAIQTLRIVEVREQSDELKVQLKAELDRCTEVNKTYRNKIYKFMAQKDIWHISQIDYYTRIEYQAFLRNEVEPQCISGYVRALDRIKLHSIKEQSQLVIVRKGQIPRFESKLLYLPYHPNPVIAEAFLMSRARQELLWDFEQDVDEKLKMQIYECLHYSLNDDTDDETMRVRLIGLHNLYEFCIREKIADIGSIELENEIKFKNWLSACERRKCTNGIITFCRKVLFLLNSEMDWDANVWFLERMSIQPERMNPSAPIQSISFLEVTHKENRKILKAYMKYCIGMLNVSLDTVRLEFLYVRKFLADIETVFGGNICDITHEHMETFFRRESKNNVQAETYNKVIISILHFFEFLRIRGYIQNIPFDQEQYLKKVFINHHNRSVEIETICAIYKKLYLLPEVSRLMFLHLSTLGLRISEVCTLKADAYYMDDQDTWIQVYQVKMKDFKRIPIPSALYSVMKVYIKKHHIAPNEYVFKNRKGGPYCKNTFSLRMIKFCEENQIKNGDYFFKSHDYRHTLATFFYNKGVSLQGIRDYLGHMYEEMTLQYVDYMPQKVDEANEVFFTQNNLASILQVRG